MSTRGKIAFIHYPYAVHQATLESMPFALNIIKSLDRAGWEVDLYLWEEDTTAYSGYFSGNVRTRRLNSCEPTRIFRKPMYTGLNYLNAPFIRLEVKGGDEYACVFGVGQIGAWLACLMARAKKVPYICINDEFPSAYPAYETDYWARCEREAVAGASLVIVPDECRIDPLSRELGLEFTRERYAVLPNAIETPGRIEAIDWHEKLGIPQDRIPLLHAGSVSDWAQVPEILGSMAYWPDNTVLVINSRSAITSAYRSQLSHLILKDRVFWAAGALREDELNSLVASCLGSFALYRDLGDNVRYIGWSSGKLMRSIVCGRPVIASRYPSLDFVESEGVGRLVTHPSEIPDAVHELVENSSQYSKNCRRYADETINFANWWRPAADKFRVQTGISLA